LQGAPDQSIFFQKNKTTVINAIAKVLNSETEPGQISLALCLAMIAGFTPVLAPHNLVVLFLVLVPRANLSSFALGRAFFSAAAYLLDLLFHRIGLAVLTASVLTELWTGLYNTTWFCLDRLNNTIVMGSLLFSLALFILAWFLFNLIIRRYREHILAWVRKTRLMQAFKATKRFEMYQSVSGPGGQADRRRLIRRHFKRDRGGQAASSRYPQRPGRVETSPNHI
jgi:uncharacterized protein (TIGR03546 family)